MICELNVNGENYEVDVAPMTPLSSVLRDDLALKGTKVGCGEGRCGACTVLLDGQPVVSCLYPIALAAARRLRTVEGLADSDRRLSPLQEALVESGGIQCGICTPGVLMSLTAALEQDPGLDDRGIRLALAGNICRCTGYQKIVEAVLASRQVVVR